MSIVSARGVKRPINAVLTAKEADKEIFKQRRKQDALEESANLKQRRKEKEEDERVVNHFFTTVVAEKQQEAIAFGVREIHVQRTPIVGAKRRAMLKTLMENKNYSMMNSNVNDEFVFSPMQQTVKRKPVTLIAARKEQKEHCQAEQLRASRELIIAEKERKLSQEPLSWKSLTEYIMA